MYYQTLKYSHYFALGVFLLLTLFAVYKAYKEQSVVFKSKLTLSLFLSWLFVIFSGVAVMHSVPIEWLSLDWFVKKMQFFGFLSVFSILIYYKKQKPNIKVIGFLAILGWFYLIAKVAVMKGVINV